MQRPVVLTDDVGQQLRTGPGVTVERLTGWDRSAPLVIERVKRLSHGSVSGPASREGRGYVMRGVTSGLTAEAAILEQQRVKAMFAALGDGVLEVRDPDSTRAVTVHLDGEILADDDYLEFGWFRWEIPLWADDPYRYGPARVTTITPTQYGPGLQYPLFEPGHLDFGQLATAPVQPITNSGDTTMWPLVRVYADCPSGFRLRSGSRVVEWRDACSLAAPVVVDMSGSVLLAGGMDASSSLARREWISVPRESSTVIELELLGPGTGWAEVTARDTWI